MPKKRVGSKRTVREKEHHYKAPKNNLLRKEGDEVPPARKTKKKIKKKTRMKHLFKKGNPHGSRTY